MIVYYAKVSTTDREEYLFGYELGNPSTGNVEVLKLKGWE